MNRVEFEREYWESEANGGHIDSAVCDAGLEQDCFNAIHGHLKYWKILEIGCGIGRMINEIARHNDYRKCSFYGVDISESMLKSVNKYVQPRQKVEYKLNDGRSIPYPDKTFDSIYSLAVFQHIDDAGVKVYLDEAKRVLKDDGVLRFQYVSGDEKIAFSWQRHNSEMAEWLRNTGLDPVSIDSGLVFPNWVWITATKVAQVNK